MSQRIERVMLAPHQKSGTDTKLKRVNYPVFFSSLLLFFLLVLSPLGSVGLSKSKDNTAREVEKNVDASIKTRQSSQKALEKWQEEKYELIATYEALLQENDFLKTNNERLNQELSQRRESVAALKLRKLEDEKLAREMLPFLNRVHQTLTTFVNEDVPFLQDERSTRMERLTQVMSDLRVPMTEKFRKIMEVLFIEAEYGNTIEVNRSKIAIDGVNEDMLADIFRLGRISLFALSLDRQKAAYFHVSQRKWLPLGAHYVPTIQGAIEMAGKQRTADILSMPLGKIVTQ